MMGGNPDFHKARIPKPLIAILLLSVLFLSGCPQEDEAPPVQEGNGEPEYLAEEPEASPEPLVTKIGFIGPLTGENASAGQEALNSLKLAASELSDNLYAYEVIEQDGKCTYPDAAEALEYLVDFRGVDAVIGGLCPQEVDGMAASLEGRSAILVSLAEGTIDNGQVMSFSERGEPAEEALAELCASRDVRRLLVFTDGSSIALSKKALFESAARKEGIAVLPGHVYGSNFASTSMLIKEAKPEGIVVIAESADGAAQLVNALRSYGVECAIFGDQTIVLPEAISAMGENSEGVYSLASGLDYGEASFSYFLTEYSFRYGSPADYGLVANAANAFYLLAQAQDFYSYRATPQDLKNYWLNLDSWEGFGGTLFFEHGDRVSPFRGVVVSGGRVEELP